ncbi:cellulose biosynthesis cyclic di-GMP-binding regulatory protein BcsB [Paenibacillus sp. HB172176]|uniref:cellulose biosynthesis cyclic di-GMP-binding regulatory protein BcsB n=1 Tax=Paenibacillus sp. HB172176 TaxID=2493690 RepID=UPI00143A1432|nr:cellulose biosynthesis cyclic di-GMP-binding regulatory protein BcsB [Paenibacillus sp. HB172176]
MQSRLRKMAILILAMLITFQMGVVTTYAASEELGRSYVTSFESVTLKGYSTGNQQYFNVEEYWQVNDAKVNLNYEVSALMQSESSSVTLSLNGTPFYSFRPVANESKHQDLVIELPLNLLIKGSNTLSIEGFLQSTGTDLNQVCVQTDSQDKWLQIYDTSTISLNYLSQPMKETISDFNQRFLGRDTVSEELNAIVLPEKNDKIEMEAAVYALSGLAKANPLKESIIPLLTYESKEVKEKKTVVFVSLYDHLPDEIKSKLKSRNMDNEALLQLITVDGQAMLVVTSNSPDLLIRAGRLVANQDLMQQMNKSMKAVEATTEVDTPNVLVSRTQKLTDAGDKLTGALHREITYYVSLPGNRSIADASKISLDYSYSQNLDFDRSLMTILVNNTPIGSKKLTSELANGDTIQLPIPKTLDISGNFSITVAFDLEILNNTCMQNQNQMPWAFISKDSMIQINTADEADLSFNNYPYPFLRDGSYNQLDVVLPMEMDTYSYQAISNLFNLLGQFAVTNTGTIQFLDDNIDESELKNHQVIAIGSYEDNQVIRTVNQNLYFKFDQKGSTILSNEKISIDSEYGKLIGTIQLLESPFAEEHGLLVVTGVNKESIYLASKLLKTSGDLWKVYGDGVLTDKDGTIKAFRFKKEMEQEESSALSTIMDRGDVLAFTIAVMLILFLILLSLILMIRKYRRKRSD